MLAISFVTKIKKKEQVFLSPFLNFLFLNWAHDIKKNLSHSLSYTCKGNCSNERGLILNSASENI